MLKKNSEEILEIKKIYNFLTLKDKNNLEAEVEIDDNNHSIETLIPPKRAISCCGSGKTLEEPMPLVAYWNYPDADLQSESLSVV